MLLPTFLMSEGVCLSPASGVGAAVPLGEEEVDAQAFALLRTAIVGGASELAALEALLAEPGGADRVAQLRTQDAASCNFTAVHLAALCGGEAGTMTGTKEDEDGRQGSAAAAGAKGVLGILEAFDALPNGHWGSALDARGRDPLEALTVAMHGRGSPHGHHSGPGGERRGPTRGSGVEEALRFLVVHTNLLEESALEVGVHPSFAGMSDGESGEASSAVFRRVLTEDMRTREKHLHELLATDETGGLPLVNTATWGVGIDGGEEVTMGVAAEGMVGGDDGADAASSSPWRRRSGRRLAREPPVELHTGLVDPEDASALLRAASPRMAASRAGRVLPTAAATEGAEALPFANTDELDAIMRRFDTSKDGRLRGLELRRFIADAIAAGRPPTQPEAEGIAKRLGLDQDGNGAIEFSHGERVAGLDWDRFLRALVELKEDARRRALRTSQTAWVPLSYAPAQRLLAAAEQRLGIPKWADFEDIQVLRYAEGEHYGSHSDGEDRLLTLFLVLSSPVQGGETSFPYAKRMIQTASAHNDDKGGLRAPRLLEDENVDLNAVCHDAHNCCADGCVAIRVRDGATLQDRGVRASGLSAGDALLWPNYVLRPVDNDAGGHSFDRKDDDDNLNVNEAGWSPAPFHRLVEAWQPTPASRSTRFEAPSHPPSLLKPKPNRRTGLWVDL